MSGVAISLLVSGLFYYFSQQQINTPILIRDGAEISVGILSALLLAIIASRQSRDTRLQLETNMSPPVTITSGNSTLSYESLMSGHFGALRTDHPRLCVGPPPDRSFEDGSENDASRARSVAPAYDIKGYAIIDGKWMPIIFLLWNKFLYDKTTESQDGAVIPVAAFTKYSWASGGRELQLIVRQSEAQEVGRIPNRIVITYSSQTGTKYILDIDEQWTITNGLLNEYTLPWKADFLSWLK